MIPELTPLQMLILSNLAGRERAGRELRKTLEARGHKSTSQSFYKSMSRLEDAGLVEGSSRQVEVEDHRGTLRKVIERSYRITGDGVRAFNQAQDFFRELGTGKPVGRVTSRASAPMSEVLAGKEGSVA